MDLTFLDTYQNLKDQFKSNSALVLLSDITKFLATCNKDGLIQIVFKLYGKWPHANENEIIISGIKRAIQTKFYNEIYGHQPSKRVLEDADAHMQRLDLHETPKPDKKVQIKKTQGQPQPQPKPKKERIEMAKKPKDEFSQKVAGMNLDQVLAWAKEVGVPQEKIDQHKSKQLGLAKMNISNMIRARLKNKKKE
jgi:hypothetical protein